MRLTGNYTRWVFHSITLALYFASSQAHAQAIYKWVDKDGGVHFSNAPAGDLEGAKPKESGAVGRAAPPPTSAVAPNTQENVPMRGKASNLREMESTVADMQKQLSALETPRKSKELKLAFHKQMLVLLEKRGAVNTDSTGAASELESIALDMEGTLQNFEREMEWLLNNAQDRESWFTVKKDIEDGRASAKSNISLTKKLILLIERRNRLNGR